MMRQKTASIEVTVETEEVVVYQGSEVCRREEGNDGGISRTLGM